MFSDLEGDDWEQSFADVASNSRNSISPGVKNEVAEGEGSDDMFDSFENRFDEQENSQQQTSLDSDSERVKELLSEGKELNAVSENLNSLLSELLLAAQLKYSQEKSSPPPISHAVSVKLLSSGNFLLLIKLRNETKDKHLKSWELILEWNASAAFKSRFDAPSSSVFRSKTLPIPLLSPGQQVEAELLCDEICRLPLLLRIFLQKVFQVPQSDSALEQLKEVLLCVGCDYFSLWDLVQTIESCRTVCPKIYNLETKKMCFGPVEEYSFKLKFSQTFVSLVCGGEYSCKIFLHWLLPNRTLSVTENLGLEPQERKGDSVCCEQLTLSGFYNSRICLTLAKESKPQVQMVLTVCLNTTEANTKELGIRLRKGLLHKILVALQRMRLNPVSPKLNFQSLRSEFNRWNDEISHISPVDIADVFEFVPIV